jgi:hypothetical protein
MSKIPHLKSLDRNKLQVVKSGDQINLYYVDDSKKALFHTKTTCWTCPFGRDDQGKLLAVVSDNEFFKLEELDQYGRDICKYFMKQENMDIPEDDSDLPYKSLLGKEDGLDILNLTVNDSTRFFDNNGVKLSPDQMSQFTSGQFSGYFLLSFTLRIWRSGNTISKFYWSISPVQIRIKKYCTLPEGCEIYEDEEKLKSALKERKKIVIKSRSSVADEPVEGFDPDVNELLD